MIRLRSKKTKERGKEKMRRANNKIVGGIVLLAIVLVAI